MKTIIIPTDFSSIATNALHYGIDMAQSVNASLILLHVYQVPVTMTDVPVVLISVEELQKNAEERLANLKKEVERISLGKLKIYTEARLGNVTDELEELCNKIQPFAVVMGSKGASAVERIIFGSNTLTAIRHLTWPVICVPSGKQFGQGLKKIGFACDFKNVVETTPTHFIKEFVKTFNAELLVLNIDYHNRQFNPETPEQSILLHTMLEDVKPSFHFIDDKDAEEGINEFAEKIILICW
jgi:nucleotide-binding universal stress UspA family protein